MAFIIVSQSALILFSSLQWERIEAIYPKRVWLCYKSNDSIPSYSRRYDIFYLGCGLEPYLRAQGLHGFIERSG